MCIHLSDTSNIYELDEYRNIRAGITEKYSDDTD